MDEQVREEVAAERRLVELRLLLEYAGALNTSTMEIGLKSWGLRYVDRPMIRDDYRWLAHRGLVAIEEKGDHLIAAIQPRGIRVARGQDMVDGVAVPSR